MITRRRQLAVGIELFPDKVMYFSYAGLVNMFAALSSAFFDSLASDANLIFHTDLKLGIQDGRFDWHGNHLFFADFS
jgi:hypothetical protein